MIRSVAARARTRRARSSPGPWRRRSRTDAGFSIVEVVVAIFVLGVVVTPLTRLVVTSSDATTQLHLRTEAVDLASQQLESTQYELNAGATPALGVTRTKVISGGYSFSVVTDLAYVVGSASATLCGPTSAGETSSKIERITATVGWGAGSVTIDASHGDTVVEKTLYAPAQENLNATQSGEIAISVDLYSVDPVTTTLDVTVPINFELAPDECTGTGSECDTVPTDEVTTGTASTGTTGCAVFTDLDPDWTYTATAVDNPGYADASQESDLPTANGVPTILDITTTGGSVTAPAALLLGFGTPVTVGFQAYKFGLPLTTSGASPPVDLPVSIQEGTGPVTTLDGSGGFATASTLSGTALLFPASATTMWAGEPDDESYGGTFPLATTSTTATLPLYPLVLSSTTSAPLQSALLTDGSEALTLQSPTAATAPYISTTAVPAGTYTLTTGGASDSFLTVTSIGTCTGATASAVATCTATSKTFSTTAITVTG